MLEPDAGFSIKHEKKSPSLPPNDTPTPDAAAPVSNPNNTPTPTAEPLPRPTFAELEKEFSAAPTTSNPTPQPNIQTIQTSDPNFVVTKNLDAASVFSTAAPTASFADITEKKPDPTPVDEPPRPAIEISNPMAPRALFEETPSTTPSVAFNDPASAPDAPRPGTDPNKKKGIDKEDIKRLKEKLNTPELKSTVSSIKTNPMRALLIGSSIIIIILIIAIALVS